MPDVCLRPDFWGAGLSALHSMRAVPIAPTWTLQQVLSGLLLAALRGLTAARWIGRDRP